MCIIFQVDIYDGQVSYLKERKKNGESSTLE